MTTRADDSDSTFFRHVSPSRLGKLTTSKEGRIRRGDWYSRMIPGKDSFFTDYAFP